MYLKEFKQQIKQAEATKIFDFGISKPFSWRGNYYEVAFQILEKPMARDEILSNIEIAYTDTFNGYKGGNFTYDDYTQVNFESNYSSSTNGRYCGDWIAKIQNSDSYASQEMRLVKLAFS